MTLNEDRSDAGNAALLFVRQNLIPPPTFATNSAPTYRAVAPNAGSVDENNLVSVVLW